ncbi:hypothetical protein Pla163_12660 [Planctomycetes bacterium Pla163]|uniref:Uncharacterized protein n=1 Tax=Rohdeia mirabilis TaxID=2528008 RepID=A0A518CY53_9BACT|nr:hypothetical protein Pla163_12660 [Planctomycetes bacterium Pla163]
MTNESIDFDALHDRVWDLHKGLRLRSAHTLALEMQARAKDERDLNAYVQACFLVLNTAPGVLQPEVGKRASLEMIALLESRDAAVEFQPDMDDDAYRSNVYWYSACAYDNLATSIADMYGANSPGLDSALNEGIAVCRRTGKTGCIGCFRAYGRARALAADDLDMALHFARSARAPGSTADETKRFAAAIGEASILTSMGDVAGAERALAEARERVTGSTFEAEHDAECQIEAATLACLRGDEPQPFKILEQAPPFDPDEAPRTQIALDHVAALRASLTGDFEGANHLLEALDRRLWRAKRIDKWFENRLRLIANDLRAGRGERVEGLVRQLRERARDARDHLTLRRLDLLEASGVDAWPHAPLAPPRAVLTVASSSAAVPVEADTTTLAESSEVHEAETALRPPPEFVARVRDLQRRVAAARREDGDLTALETELFALEPEPDDRDGRVALLSAFYDLDPFASDPARTWQHVRRLAAGLEDDGVVLSYLAFIGWMLRRVEGSAMGETILEETLVAWFDRSVELAPDDVGVRARAASWFLDRGDEDRAERLLARAARLDRSDAWVTLRLAELYGRSGRSTDALAVLDLALRSGNDDPDVLWAAVGRAAGLAEHQALVSYVRRYAEHTPDSQWVPYYELLGLVGSGRHAEAAEKLAAAEAAFPALAFAWESYRVPITAATHGPEETRRVASHFLARPTREVEDLNRYGVFAALERVLLAAESCEGLDDVADAVRRRALELGLGSASILNAWRAAREEETDVHYFDVTIEQDLPADWDARDQRLDETAGWKRLSVSYGVLAFDREEAERVALEHHPRFGPTPRIVDVDEDESTYRDQRGLMRQSGFRPGEDGGGAG